MQVMDTAAFSGANRKADKSGRDRNRIFLFSNESGFAFFQERSGAFQQILAVTARLNERIHGRKVSDL